MDMNDAQFLAALRTFEASHPDAATWLHWLFATLQTNAAHLTALAAAQEETRAIQQRTDAKLAAVSALLVSHNNLLADYTALLADHDALVEQYTDLKLLYAARVAVDEAEEGDC